MRKKVACNRNYCRSCLSAPSPLNVADDSNLGDASDNSSPKFLFGSAGLHAQTGNINLVCGTPVMIYDVVKTATVQMPKTMEWSVFVRTQSQLLCIDRLLLLSISCSLLCVYCEYCNGAELGRLRCSTQTR